MHANSRIRRAPLLLAVGALGGVLFGPDRPVDAHAAPLQLCNAKEQRCNGKCVPVSPQTGCGDQQCRACVVVGAVPACEAGKYESACGYSKCQSGHVDLDGVRQNGCEAIEVPRLEFETPRAYVRTATPDRVRYHLSDVPAGWMRRKGDRVATDKTIYLNIPPGPALTEIDRCFALAASMPATAKVWIEMYGSPGTLHYQIPYTDNSPSQPPNYAALVLELQSAPKPTVVCHVNRTPPP